MQKIKTFLWFDDNAQEAAEFYVSLFKNSKINAISHYPENVSKVAGQPTGSVMTVDFELDGQQFVAMNGGPQFKFTEAISLAIGCKDQAEVDYYWEKLAEGGEHSYCGWLKDKYGLSWQVTPVRLMELVESPDRAVVERVMGAMMEMQKIDISEIEKAYAEV